MTTDHEIAAQLTDLEAALSAATTAHEEAQARSQQARAEAMAASLQARDFNDCLGSGIVRPVDADYRQAMALAAGTARRLAEARTACIQTQHRRDAANTELDRHRQRAEQRRRREWVLTTRPELADRLRAAHIELEQAKHDPSRAADRRLRAEHAHKTAETAIAEACRTAPAAAQP